MRNANQLPPAEDRERPESPCSPDWERVFEPGWNAPRGEHKKRIEYVASASSTHIPETAMQALMEAAPFEDPATSLEDVAHLRERLADAIDALPERLRWIFEARFFRGLSVREVGREMSLSKSYVDRLYNQALRELQTALVDLINQQ